MVKMENNFTAKYLIALLNMSGIALESQKFQTKGRLINMWKYYLLYSFTFLTTSQVLTLQSNETAYEASMTLIFIFNGIFLNITIIIMHIKKECIMEMLNIFSIDFVTVSRQTGFSQSTNERFKNFFLSYVITYYTIYIIMILSPFLFFPISDNKLGDTNTLLIPCWFPWVIDTYTKYILTIALQFSWLGALSIPILLSFTFVTYFVIEVKSQVEILSKVVVKWKNDDFKFENGTMMCLVFKRFIMHHQILLRFVRNFCACYNWVFMGNLIYSAANLTLIFFAIGSGEKTVPAIMQQISVFFMVFLYLLLYCFIGEVLCEVNETIKTTLYDVEWFEQSVEFKRLFAVFMCIIQRDLNLKAGRANYASFQLFTKVLKMSYSYFNIMSNAF